MKGSFRLGLGLGLGLGDHLKSSAEADSMRAYWMASLTRCGELRLILRESTRPECK